MIYAGLGETLFSIGIFLVMGIVLGGMIKHAPKFLAFFLVLSLFFAVILHYELIEGLTWANFLDPMSDVLGGAKSSDFWVPSRFGFFILGILIGLISF